MIFAAIHGLVLAFPLIMPLGAQNVFIFNQGASQPKFSKVIPIVITAAICDTLLISLAVMGISVIILGSLIIKSVLIGVGTLFLLYMGWVSWSSEPNTTDKTPNTSLSAKKQMVFAASVSLFNPHAIMDTIGVIGISALKYTGLEKLVFAMSTILVSWIWFFGLAYAGRMTGRLDKTGKIGIVINRISAVIMWIAAVYLVFSFK